MQVNVYGENRVQEAAGKWPDLQTEFEDVELHLIGPLQTNKVKQALEIFDVFQTVDRLKLAKALAKELEKSPKDIKCFIQVNTGNEPQKAGILPEEADEFIKTCRDELKLPIVYSACRGRSRPSFCLSEKNSRSKWFKRIKHGYER